MSGMTNFTLPALFEQQAKFQERITHALPPRDAPDMFEYHITAMVEELGEVLKADKRWKSHRNTRYEPAEKLDELADVFITAMNLALWSGFSGEDIAKAIASKIAENNARLDNK